MGGEAGRSDAGDGSNGPVVLVVEDNGRNRKLFRDLFSFRSIVAKEAADGQTALAMAMESPPALILMDLQLPDMDGFEALRQLRADARTRDVPVVAVTALAMKGDRERCLQAGFDGYLCKPIDARTFVDDVMAHGRSPGG